MKDIKILRGLCDLPGRYFEIERKITEDDPELCNIDEKVEAQLLEEMEKFFKFENIESENEGFMYLEDTLAILYSCASFIKRLCDRATNVILTSLTQAAEKMKEEKEN